MKAAFVQPFGIGSMSGGGRILRSLIGEAGDRIVSISTSPSGPGGTPPVRERHVPRRPSLGRIENTRFASIRYWVDPLYAPRFEARLKQALAEEKVDVVHALAHSLDFYQAWRAARSLNLPFVLTVHDDVRYNLQGHPWLEKILKRLGEVWRDADRRIVISEEMGQEYSRRYGEAESTMITDGLEEASFRKSEAADPNRQMIYFMGLLHNGYIPNVIALLRAIKQQNETAGTRWELVMRCGRAGLDVPPDVSQYLTILPFGSQEDIEREMDQSKMVYMPLAFGEEYADFNRFSLSTKMVSYLAAGRPILYHGPPESAAERLLSRNGAAIVLDSLEEAAIGRALETVVERQDDVVQAAERLGRSRFMLEDQRRRLWDVLEGARQARALA